jgi:metal-dependent amidase/aminoacylase/carboxypeptidase family protein
VKIYRDIHR